VGLAVQFAILGLASGGLYALMGLGLIIVHRASGAINFANGAIAVSAGYALVYLESRHVPTALAVVLSVLVGLVLGLAIQALVMRPLRAASPLTKAIATLGVLVVLQAACQLQFGSQPALVPGFLPQDGFTFLGAHLTTDYVIILAIALILSAGLWWIYRHTRFGLATAAVAENEEAVGALGWSGSLIARGNWALAGTLAALSGVLLAPVIGVSLPEMTDALLLPGLAAALFGGLSSFPVATAGALLIGIAQSELTLYGNDPVIRSFPDISDAVPFLVIIVILVLRGRTMPARDFVEAHLPSLGSGRIRLRVALPAIVIAALLIQVILPVNWVIATNTCLIAGILLLSLVVLVGYAGQLSLAQLSIGGLGALATARLTTSLGWPLPIAIVAGVIAAIPIGLIVGLPAVRTRGAALAVVTLGLATALNDLVFSSVSVTGGYAGINVGYPHLFGVNVAETSYPRRFSLFAFLLFTVIAVVICNLRASALGRRLIAVRSNERAAASLGVSTVGSKLFAFVLSSMIATVGSVLVAFRYPNAIFDNFDPFQSVNYVVEAVIGGVGYVMGAAAGTGIEPGGLGNKIVSSIGLGSWLTFIGGVLLLITVIANPDGLVGSVLAQLAPLRRRLGGGRRRPAAVTVADVDLTQLRRPEPALLTVADLTVRFGAVTAVNHVDLELRSGEVLGIIGPNGAGKTTLIDAITGYVASVGAISLNGRQLQGLPPHRRSRLGIIRSFQSLELFEDLTVAENLLVASEDNRSLRGAVGLIWRRPPQLRGAAAAAVREFELTEFLQRPPADLSYGQRRLLAISRAVACHPHILMLDEPAAGLDDHDRQALKVMLRRLSETWGISVLLIEHDVDLVMSVSDRVIALNFGSVTAAGTPAEVRRHPEVIRSYLGTDDPPTEAVPPAASAAPTAPAAASEPTAPAAPAAASEQEWLP
jgi:ABC-type branched-subunit amino acid transport system ATPase component/ABC-type branched-subunit amino acid transport system permease subunit